MKHVKIIALCLISLSSMSCADYYSTPGAINGPGKPENYEASFLAQKINVRMNKGVKNVRGWIKDHTSD